MWGGNHLQSQHLGGGAEIQGHPLATSKFVASLVYMRSCIKQKQKTQTTR